MSLTPSNEFPSGTPAPDFSLIDTVSKKIHTLADIAGTQATVVAFICNHCPFVIHINAGLIQLAKDYQDKNIGFVAISSNDVMNYPQDGPQQMKERALALGYPFPYLYDETQETAQAYNAACTPDFYVFDNDLCAVYHGQLDDSRPNNTLEVTGSDIREILDHLLENKPYGKVPKPSIGCNIKWK